MRVATAFVHIVAHFTARLDPCVRSNANRLAPCRLSR